MPDVPGAPYRHSTQPLGSFVNLQPSEAAVLAAAAQIFAGYFAAREVNEKTEAALLERSVELAIRLTQRVDIRVQSAEEEKK